MLTHSDFLVEISTDPLNSLLNCFLSCQRCGNCGVERELILFFGHPWWQRHVSTWAGNRFLLEGKVHPLPGFVPGSLDSHMKGVWGLYPTLSVFLLGCFSPGAKGTSQCCRFLSFFLCSQRSFGFPEWKCPGFPKVQCLCCSKILRPFKSCIFLDILRTLSDLSHLHMSVIYLECSFISATIFLISLKDHIVVFFFPQALPFS